MLPALTIGASYMQQLSASGGSGTGYEFNATGVPTGLTLNVSGLLSGTPTTAAEFTMIVTVTDSNDSTGSQSYSIVVEQAITLSPSSVPTPLVGQAFSQQLTASGGSGSGYTFTSGPLPPGLTLSPTGLISGTPTVASVQSLPQM